MPPPFTVFYFLHLGLKQSYTFLLQLMTNAKEAREQTAAAAAAEASCQVEMESPTQRQRKEQKQLLDIEKREFDKRYSQLMVCASCVQSAVVGQNIIIIMPKGRRLSLS